MTVSRVHRRLYRAASLLGDVSAVVRGPDAYGRRMIRKQAWRLGARATRRAVRDV